MELFSTSVTVCTIKLAYAIFYTDDINRIVSFYRDSLGFEFAFGDQRFATFKIGDALLGIKIRELDREIAGHQTAIIEVEDVHHMYQTAQEKNWNIFTSLTNEEWGKNFSILDPDGNRVEFFSK